MSHKTYTQAGVAAVAALLALAASAVLAPGALSAQQNVNNANTKAGKTKTATPARSAPPVKPVKTAQPPPAAKENDSSLKKSTKVGEAEKTTYSKLLHQYVFDASDTGTGYGRVAVRVRNEGKGPARAGKVTAIVATLSKSGDPRKSEILGYPYRWGWKKYEAEAELPALKPGETADVFLNFNGVPHPQQRESPTNEWKLGVVIEASNKEEMADGKFSAEHKGYLSYGFFNK